jgi:hypothetical protein
MFVITGRDWFGQHGQHSCVVLQCSYVAINVVVSQVLSFTLSYCVIRRLFVLSGSKTIVL